MKDDPAVGKPAGPQEPAFKTDFRTSNPDLHRLYTRWAVRHLHLIDRIQKRLGEESNGAVMEVQVAIREARENLIQTDAAFADAHEILRFTETVDHTGALRLEDEEPGEAEDRPDPAGES